MLGKLLKVRVLQSYDNFDYARRLLGIFKLNMWIEANIKEDFFKKDEGVVEKYFFMATFI